MFSQPCLTFYLYLQVGLQHNGLVPTFHCMHTPGGPLKYSMEGHQFAIFAMRLTSDKRYIVSVSNRFITFDVVTSDLARQVYPGVEGLMMDLELSSDDKYAAAFTNNFQIILVNNLVSEHLVIENPFQDEAGGCSKREGSVQGLRLLDNKLVVIGSRGWAVLNMAGEVERRVMVPGRPSSKYIHSIRMVSLTSASVVMWSGLESSTGMTLKTYQGQSPLPFPRLVIFPVKTESGVRTSSVRVGWW